MFTTRRGRVHFVILFPGRAGSSYLNTMLEHHPDIEIKGENQRGDVTTPGHATILLPSREHGPVRLPDPPGGASTCAGLLDALIARFDANDRDA